MKIEKDEITIRDFTETDLPLMFKWLTDKRVLEYYEGRDVRFTMDTLSALFFGRNSRWIQNDHRV